VIGWRGTAWARELSLPERFPRKVYLAGARIIRRIDGGLKNLRPHGRLGHCWGPSLALIRMTLSSDGRHLCHGIALRAVILLLALMVGCKSAKEQAVAEAKLRVKGDPERGAFLIQRYGCGGCHRIPGVQGAAGKVAPSLEHLASETYISGNLPNSPENVMRWIEAPHTILPRTKMPETGMSTAEARDITTYLWSLR